MMYYTLSFLAILLGPGLSIYGFFLFLKEIQRKRWPSVCGHVISSTIERQFAGKYGYYQYAPIVVYQFSYNDTTISNRDSFFATSRQSAEKVIQKFPAGALVKVYVNPANKMQSTLSVSPTPYSYAMICLGLFVSFIFWNALF
jgi:hypothetical protein